MSYLNVVLSDLRDRKLWPLAAALVAALVAVPVLLSKSPVSVPAHPQPSMALPVQDAHAGPAVSLQANAGQAPLKGGERDPFTQQQLANPSAGASSVAAASSAAAAGTGVGGSAGSASQATAQGGGGSAGGGAGSITTVSSGGASGASAGGSSGGATGVAPRLPGTLPTPPGNGASGTPAPPAQTGLTATEAYDVTAAVSDSRGGFFTIPAVERMSLLPSPGQPRLIELGVLQGGDRVLFGVLPGTSLSGPATCIPGPLDCEIISLPVGQTERVTANSTSVLLAVTGVSVHDYGTVGAAQRARGAVSAAGNQLWINTAYPATVLFQYEPSLCAVVDLRNLIVGGN